MIKAADLIGKFQYALSEKWGYIWGAAGGVWTQAQQDRATREMTVKYGQKWVGRHVADCSGLFSWAFKQLGGYMYHGSDTMYRKYCAGKGELKKGRRTDNGKLKPGTAVFIWNGKKFSHVGLYAGNGIVIEAMGTINGVTTTKVTASKWTHWGELTGVLYENAESAVSESSDPDPVPVSGSRPVLRKGSKSQTVMEMQTMLDKLGYDLGSYGVDGDFGRATEVAVKSFQSDHRLAVDGICGPMTWDALDRAAGQLDPEPVKIYSVTVHGLTMAAAEALAKKYPDSTIREE